GSAGIAPPACSSAASATPSQRSVSPWMVVATVSRGNAESVAASSGTTTGDGRTGDCGGAACWWGPGCTGAGAASPSAAVAGGSVRAGPVLVQAGRSSASTETAMVDVGIRIMVSAVDQMACVEGYRVSSGTLK